MQWIVRRLAWEAIRSLIVDSWESVKKQSWWDRVGAGVCWLTGLWAEVPVEGKIVMALTGFSLFMAIRQMWFPHLFRKKRLRETEHQSIAENQQKPIVLPIEYGTDKLGYQGLFLKNDGSGSAFHVILDPLQMDGCTVRFTGAEVTYLRVGDRCFFSLGNVSLGPLKLDLKSSSTLLNLLRSWQTKIGDKWEAKVEGRIRYKDVDNVEYETRYSIGADVLSESGLAIKFIGSSRK